MMNFDILHCYTSREGIAAPSLILASFVKHFCRGRILEVPEEYILNNEKVPGKTIDIFVVRDELFNEAVNELSGQLDEDFSYTLDVTFLGKVLNKKYVGHTEDFILSTNYTRLKKSSNPSAQC